MPITELHTIKGGLPEKKKQVKTVIPQYIEGVNRENNIPSLNGFRWIFSGIPGSGKTVLIEDLFRRHGCYNGVFHNIYYFAPESTLSSCPDSIFASLPDDQKFHEINEHVLMDLFNTLKQKKVEYVEWLKDKKKKKNKGVPNRSNFYATEYDFDDEEEEEEEEGKVLEMNCLVFDDFGDAFKEKRVVEAMKKIMIQSRHVCLAIIILCQQYHHVNKGLRKLCNHVTFFRPNNKAEFESVNDEFIGLKGQEDKMKLFNYVFDKPYKHLDIDPEGNLYENFNRIQIVDEY